MTYNNAQERSNIYRHGLSEEKRVIEFLRTRGNQVEISTENENKFQDIDCWVNGKSVSIKAQHKGQQYGNIYLELANHLTFCQNDPLTAELITDLNEDRVRQLLAAKTWEPGWFLSGKAELYLILQGTTLRGFSKSVINRYIAENGYLRIRSLSANVRRSQGGSYRYCNTICGFIPNSPDKVKQAIWTMPPSPTLKAVAA